MANDEHLRGSAMQENGIRAFTVLTDVLNQSQNEKENIDMANLKINILSIIDYLPNQKVF